MNHTRLMTRVGIVLSGLGVVALLGLGYSRASAPSASTAVETAAKVEPIGDTGIKKLTLTEKAVQRLAVITFPVTAQPGGKTMVPYRALLYLPNGRPFVYTNPEPRVYVRQEIAVESIAGERVVLTAGPPVDTRVVTTGGAELWGTEFGVK